MCMGGSTPSVTTPAAPPSTSDADVKAAAAAEEARLRKARGRQASILTSPSGDTTDADTTKKTLLGG